MTYSYNVEYSEEAYEDLREIYDYVANELLVPKTAENLLKNIRTAIRSLSNMPFRHTLVDWEPWYSMKIRQFPVENFIVYYLVEENKRMVSIVRIFYNGRDISKIINSKT
ncbi:Plasmid stabilization system protein ParE [Sharpea azabuensis]|uniref:type II toxin-antitoxin system RelE/ParE family toxin n=1 Tax=Sharpea azabuensis TaxID=322505 RepID=UPI0008E380DB|nr:type II toxin-antitoxin system RelE/ParE family toxin [Sharpea azabuensis]SFD89616.1 Plasmid stabilization system protein ParE [Sharpea azabuensis]SFK99066.1 Plasmid stabilization system protein ParE [Sharpea azabuensis]